MRDTPPLGMPGNPVKLTDPRTMRALAHPARLAIWGHLGLRGPATATECAEAAGVSPSAASYHLRALAKYGFVEEDLDSAADGRQRPWRARVLTFETELGQDPVADMAAQFLAENVRVAVDDIRARYQTRLTEYPVEWQRATGQQADVVHVTPAELDELRRRTLELAGEYRRLEPAERPPGALPVLLWHESVPWFGPEEAKEEAEEQANAQHPEEG
jgi:DNA-binding transcriptional ArsR family regulator